MRTQTTASPTGPHRARRRLTGVLAAAAAMTLIAGCGGQGREQPTQSTQKPGGGRTYTTGLVNQPQPPANPAEGGTLSMASFSEPRSLDPAKTVPAGATGGTEMAAIYDVLMRWEASSKKVVPQLAESMQPDAQGTTWTLKLRPGVRFSDGSPLNAEAVRWSLERYVREGTDEAALFRMNLDGVQVVDEQTLTMRLKKPWATFDYLFAGAAGMIVPASAVQPGGFKPIGAGPYTLTRQAPAEEIVLSANPGYWGGKPKLEKVRTVFLNNAQANYDSLASGNVQAAMLRDPALVDKSLDEKRPGYETFVPLGNVMLVNASPGKPGANPKVRQALAAAIDPKIVSQRGFGGAGIASKDVFPEGSMWHTKGGAPAFDQEKAKKLVEEAKAEGFDGKITYTSSAAPAQREAALAVKAMLDAAGFNCELDLVRTVAEQIQKVQIDKSYAVSSWGISWREAGPYGRIFATAHSQGGVRNGMASSPQMDALIEQLQQVSGEDQQRDVLAKIEAEWNNMAASVPLGPTIEFVTWSPKVHGVRGTINSMVLFDKASMDQ